MLSRSRTIGYLFVLMSVLAVLFLEIRLFENYFYVNSDLCYLPALFRSIFIDKIPLIGWCLTPAPYFFPDGVIFFILRALASVESSFHFYHIIIFSIFLLIIFAIIKRIDLDSTTTFLILLVILAGVLFRGLSARHYFRPFMDLLTPSFHGGATVCGLLAVYFAVSYYAKGLKRYLIGYSICSVLTGFSDRIFLLQFSAPLILSNMLLLIIHPVAWKRRIWNINWASIITAGLAYLFIPVFTHYVAYIPASVMQPEGRFVGFISLFGRDIFYLINRQTFYAILLLFLFCTVMAMIGSQRYGKWPFLLRVNPLVKFVLMFVFFSTLLTVLCVPLIIGWLDYACFRYFIPIYFLPPIAVSMIIGAVMDKWRKIIQFIAFAIIVCLGGFSFASFAVEEVPGLRAFGCINQFDSLLEKHDLSVGLGDYWHAKLYSSASERGVQINQLYPDLRPRFWIFNKYWFKYDRSFRYPEYDFIIVDGLNEKKIVARFGTPRDIIHSCAGKVFVYDRESDYSFRNFLRSFILNNFGEFNKINPVMNYEKLNQYKNDGVVWNSEDNVIIPKRGSIVLEFETAIHGDILDISLDSNDSYQIEFLEENELVNPIIVPESKFKGGIQGRIVFIGDVLKNRHVNRVRIQGIEGDGRYSVGYIAVYDDTRNRR